MRKYWTMCLLTIACTALTGCNQMGVKQDPHSAFEQVRDQFAAQNSYAFYGRTKLLTANSANANMVNFSGRKDGEAVYMNVKFSVPEQQRVETLSLLSEGSELYAKQGQEEKWKPVPGEGVALRQEMNNWSPPFCFQQMDELKKSVRQLPDENPQDDLEAIGVTLDSLKLKEWLAAQMQEQAGAGSRIQSAAGPFASHKPRVKLAMQLSDGNWTRAAAPGAGVSIQAKQAQAQDVKAMVDQMDVEAEYTIYYNKKTMLPTNMTMSIRSAYDLNDQRVKEHSQVETYLQNYGRAKPVPTAAEGGK
ncbi:MULTISPECIES: DUF6612 family protein [Brevibacillus]|jgi:hypothetical protein|uniref:DUF6612 family protein n=1 Tax=Brevibacillus TaxID=55080 RepID=UPI00156A7E6B|nr:MULTISPECIES: DUF6612 family protein [Brevibacillus]NRQ57128.1 hypothetical protein [Brevibacillus sp. HD1.4A]WDV93805.1 hypothetical protein PSE45_19475 [Brevibacillus parabrevis]